jgi:hypothetical protein
MEANTSNLIWKKPFGTAEDLCDLLLSAAQDSNTAMSEINVEVCSDGDRCKEPKAGMAVLEAEALSDASVVYNITLH